MTMLKPKPIESTKITILPPTSRFIEWTLPARGMLLSLLYIPSAVWATMVKRGGESFSSIYFAKFWAGITEEMAAECGPEKHRVASGCHGVVIEVGPGFGPNIQDLEKGMIQRVYAVEPNKGLCKGLRKKADELEWGEDHYVIISCGIEDEEELRKAGVPIDGGVDTVLIIQGLCTIPDPQKVLRCIYHYLKPGGELRIVEHVQSSDSATQRVQAFYDYLWHIPFGGCNLSRQTQKWLLNPEFMGFKKGEGWKNVELEKIKGESRWTVFPVIWGRLVKGNC